MGSARCGEFPDAREITPGTALMPGAAVLLGFALGGFCDGILLHQILQWHHLLSGLDGARFRNLRTQILADGLFHAAMYVLAALGLWRLYEPAPRAHAVGSGRSLVAGLAINLTMLR